MLFKSYPTSYPKAKKLPTSYQFEKVPLGSYPWGYTYGKGASKSCPPGLFALGDRVIRGGQLFAPGGQFLAQLHSATAHNSYMFASPRCFKSFGVNSQQSVDILKLGIDLDLDSDVYLDFDLDLDLDSDSDLDLDLDLHLDLDLDFRFRFIFRFRLRFRCGFRFGF